MQTFAFDIFQRLYRQQRQHRRYRWRCWRGRYTVHHSRWWTLPSHQSTSERSILMLGLASSNMHLQCLSSTNIILWHEGQYPKFLSIAGVIKRKVWHDPTSVTWNRKEKYLKLSSRLNSTFRTPTSARTSSYSSTWRGTKRVTSLWSWSPHSKESNISPRIGDRFELILAGDNCSSQVGCRLQDPKKQKIIQI